MGARLLRAWILRPEISLQEIEARLDAVAELKSRTIAREEIHKKLEGILDLERLTSRITLGVATPRDLLALRGRSNRFRALRQFLHRVVRRHPVSRLRTPSAQRGLPSLREQIDEMARCARHDRARDCRRSAGRGQRAGRDPSRISRRTRRTARHHEAGRQIIAAMEERERKRTGIASLKIRYNQVFGYYIEISKANLHSGPGGLRAQANARECRALHVDRAEGTRAESADGRRARAGNRAAALRRNPRVHRARGGAAAAHGGGDCATGCAGEFRAHRRGAELYATGIHGERRSRERRRTARRR